MKDNSKIRKYKILNVERETERFVVSISFFEGEGDDEKEVGSVKHAFPLSMTAKEIEEEAKKACVVYFEDLDRAKANAEKDKQDARAEATKEKLINKEKTI